METSPCEKAILDLILYRKEKYEKGKTKRKKNNNIRCIKKEFVIKYKNLNFDHRNFDNMSRVIRKTSFCICENSKSAPLFSLHR